MIPIYSTRTTLTKHTEDGNNESPELVAVDSAFYGLFEEVWPLVDLELRVILRHVLLEQIGRALLGFSARRQCVHDFTPHVVICQNKFTGMKDVSTLSDSEDENERENETCNLWLVGKFFRSITLQKIHLSIHPKVKIMIQVVLSRDLSIKYFSIEEQALTY